LRTVPTYGGLSQRSSFSFFLQRGSEAVAFAPLLCKVHRAWASAVYSRKHARSAPDEGLSPIRNAATCFRLRETIWARVSLENVGAALLGEHPEDVLLELRGVRSPECVEGAFPELRPKGVLRGRRARLEKMSAWRMPRADVRYTMWDVRYLMCFDRQGQTRREAGAQSHGPLPRVRQPSYRKETLILLIPPS
jgi:hypothetical protein